MTMPVEVLRQLEEAAANSLQIESRAGGNSVFIVRNKGLLLVSVLLGIPFLGGGFASALGIEAMAENFARFGYPRWFMHFVGIAEVAGAIGLFVERTALYAAVCLAYS